MTTDLRAALREAAEMLARVKPIDMSVDDDPHGLADRLRALADAPPTVAELLPRVDAKHEVRWESSNLIGLRMRARIGARGELAIEMFPKICWVGSLIHPADLAQPATLVEVTP